LKLHGWIEKELRDTAQTFDAVIRGRIETPTACALACIS
jgi:hypothetical protein